jgi:hypothetical protein
VSNVESLPAWMWRSPTGHVSRLEGHLPSKADWFATPMPVVSRLLVPAPLSTVANRGDRFMILAIVANG